MKLYSLSLQAIGPFAGVHTIDLAALGQSGLFLLEGPTGAGKSTIIDAIVFALYGDLAGESASKERLHSHHAERGVEPFVDLIFEVDSGVYRVRRSPAHQRPKRRGEGTTTQNEAVTLSRLTDIDAPDAGVPMSTSTQEVGHEIVELVGLRKDQFLQTVVLPQGEFARFLRSNGEDRKALLQTIFRTEVYEQMTKTLVELRRDANARTEAARLDVRQAVAVLASAADLETDDLLTLDGLVDDALVGEILATAQREAAMAAVAAQQTSAVRSNAEKSLADAEKLDRALERRNTLLIQQSELAVQQADVLAADEELRAGQRAAVVIGAVRAHDMAAAAAERAAASHDEARSVLGLTLSASECTERDEALGSRLAHLDSFQTMEAGFAARVRQIDELDEKVASIEVQIEEIDKRMAERPMLREALQGARTEQLSLVAGLGAAQTAADSSALALKNAIVAADKQLHLVTASATLAELSSTAQGAVAAHTELRLRRLQGMAGELASDLVDGSPCTVCGATEHPRPAERADDHPDDESIEAADVAATQAEADVVAARSVVDRLDAEMAAAREAADGLSVDDAQAAHDDAVTILGNITLAADRVEELDKELQKLEAAELDDERQRGRAAADLSQATAQLTLLTTALSNDRAQIAEQLGDEAETLAQLVEQLGAERRRVQRYASTMRELQDAAERLEAASEHLDQQLAEHKFVSADEVRAATLPTDRADHLQRLVSQHQQEVAVVQAGLASTEIAALTGEEVPGLDAAREAANQAQAADQLAAATAGTAQTRADKVAQRCEALSTAQQALDSVSADAAAVIRMAEIADGTSRANLKSLTLGTYVLMRRFEDVVAAANARLGPMSDGRYQLRATDERERGARGRRTGLALAVLDTETGQEREPRTLSGGETFYVSLCLALGLADVVTGEAGGIEIGTLFVDEGFGSLDPQTLDDVMSELTALARGGRVIGIVSHVEDLKLRVVDRIEVRRQDDGSSTLTVKV